MKIAFFSSRTYDKQFFDYENRSFGWDLTYFDSRLTLDTAALAKGAEVVSLFVNDEASKEVIDLLYQEGVRLIALRCAGYDLVDLRAALGRIRVVRVPSYSPYAVAEHAVGMALCLNRKLHRAYLRTRENNFTIDGLLGVDWHGKTAGVIGCGQIGAATISILKGFGMELLCYDVDPLQVERAGGKYVDLPTLYQTSDLISLHAPLSVHNRYLIDRKALHQMKEGVILINTSRGGLIHYEDLIAALKEGKLGGAGLDVYEGEKEYFHHDLSSTFVKDEILARLQSFPNVLITSHQAFFTQEAMTNIARTSCKDIASYFKGEPLSNELLVVA